MLLFHLSYSSLQKSYFQDLLLFDLTQSLLSGKSPKPEHLSEKFGGNCLTSQMPEVVTPIEANKSLVKNLKMKIWGMRCPYGASKASSVSLGICNTTHVCMAVHTIRWDKRRSFSLPLHDRGTRTSRKPRLMHSCKMPECWTHPKSPLAKGRFIDPRHLRKSLPNYYLSTKINRESLEWLQMTGNRCQIVSPGKSLNKQTGEWGKHNNNNKLWEGGVDLISRDATLCH